MSFGKLEHICPSCGEPKHWRLFPKATRRCRACENAKARERYANRRTVNMPPTLTREQFLAQYGM